LAAAQEAAMKFVRRIAMQWEKPESIEISLACEIGGYANAELSEPPGLQQTVIAHNRENPSLIV
jgi:hypothetical protein